jgi:hypothetical protein
MWERGSGIGAVPPIRVLPWILLPLAAMAIPASATADTATDLQTINNDGGSIADWYNSSYGIDPACDAMCAALGEQLGQGAASASTDLAAGEAIGLAEALGGLAVPVLGGAVAGAAAGAVLWEIGNELFGSEATPSGTSPYPAYPVWVEPGSCPHQYTGGNCTTITSANIPSYTGGAFHFVGHDPTGGLISSSLAQAGEWTSSLEGSMWQYCYQSPPVGWQHVQRLDWGGGQACWVVAGYSFRPTTGGTPTVTSPAPAALTGSQLLAELNAHPGYYADLIHQMALAHATAHPTIPAPNDGETATAYASRLSQLGLNANVSVLDETDTGVGNGGVVETNPESGTEVDEGTTVDVAANPNSPAVNEEDSRCDVNGGTGTVGDPGDPPPDGTGYPAFQLVQNSPYPTAVDPTGGSPQYTQVPLRWGTKDWGWRHIRQKHPYTSADEQQTMQALATDSNPTRGWPSTNQWVFHSFYSMPDGFGGSITCLRTVPVEYSSDRKASAQGLTGIRGVMNSYVGLYLGGL